jgi:hypothetical protein
MRRKVVEGGELRVECGQTKESDMIVVRDIFQLKFGMAGQAIELWKQAMEINRRLGYGGSARMLTDLVGSPYYTVVLETTYESMWEFEEAIKKVLKNQDWRGIYSKIVPLTEKGRREILNVVG